MFNFSDKKQKCAVRIENANMLNVIIDSESYKYGGADEKTKYMVIELNNTKETIEVKPFSGILVEVM